jgi:hypothetical protein
VEYYYREKQNICTRLMAVQALAQRGGAGPAAKKRGGPTRKLKSMESVFADGDRVNIDRRTTAGRLVKERERKEALAAAILSSPKARAPAHWTADEKVKVQHAFGQFGRDWPKVVDALDKQKSEMDVAAFYDKYKKKLALEQVTKSAETRLGKNYDGIKSGVLNFLDLVPAPDVPLPPFKPAVEDAINSAPGSRGGSQSGGNSPTTSTHGLGMGSPNTPRRQGNYWSAAEKELFVQALVHHGRNWDELSKMIGTKTAPQTRNFFANYRHKLGLCCYF